MRKDQKWVLERIKKDKVSLCVLRDEFAQYLKKNPEHYNVSGGLRFAKKNFKDDVSVILEFLEKEGFLTEGASNITEKANPLNRYQNILMSPHQVTIAGQRHGKWNWERIFNWLVTFAGLVVAIIALQK